MSEYQVPVRGVTTSWIMRQREFKRGVDDRRAGRPLNIDDRIEWIGGEPVNPLQGNEWQYERGRLFASVAPSSMPLYIGSTLNPKAVALYERASARNEIL
jgi:hypothetical protein